MLPSNTTTDQKRRILLAEDEQNVRRVIAAHLRRSGYEVLEAHNAPTAREIFRTERIDLVLTDLKMPDSEQDGFEVLRYVVEQTPKLMPRVPVLILTAHGTADKALEALSQGAYNLISKPCDMKELLTQVKHAIQEREDALQSLQESEPEAGRFGIIGKTPALIKIFDTIGTVADTPATVLVTGESGTGKELIARALHFHSTRASKPFIKLNCAALPDNLLESELFGHEKGAFTGAVSTKPGKFELAHTGTLFLDEIGELKLELQVKLLRSLQEQEFERVGGVRTIKVDVRLIAATNRDLEAQVKAGLFREDLFYRLKVVPVRLPPLRERIDDIPLLLEHFLTKYNKRLGKHVTGVDRTLLALLQRYRWPGNIRELENVVERMVLFTESNMLSVRHLPVELMDLMRGAEPARAPESPRVEPMRTEPVRTEPARSEPARSESVRSESVRSESARSESARSEANRAELQRPDTSRLETVRSESVAFDPARLDSTGAKGAEAAVWSGGADAHDVRWDEARPHEGFPAEVRAGARLAGPTSPAPAAAFGTLSSAGGITPPMAAGSLKDLIREKTAALEREVILQALEASAWNVTRTAERLQLSRKGLQVKMKELDIRKPGS